MNRLSRSVKLTICLLRYSKRCRVHVTMPVLKRWRIIGKIYSSHGLVMKHQTSQWGRINIALSPNHIQDQVTPRGLPLLGHEGSRDNPANQPELPAGLVKITARLSHPVHCDD